MNLDLIKEDLNKIGNTKSSKNGFLCIICNSETANIEEILLRNILKLKDLTRSRQSGLPKEAEPTQVSAPYHTSLRC